MKTEEDEAFEELEYKLGRKEVTTALENLNHELDVYRNDIIEEVAVALEKFTVPFGADTVASFTAYIRGMKT
jgi:hypothetical protein